MIEPEAGMLIACIDRDFRYIGYITYVDSKDCKIKWSDHPVIIKYCTTHVADLLNNKNKITPWKIEAWLEK